MKSGPLLGRSMVESTLFSRGIRLAAGSCSQTVKTGTFCYLFISIAGKRVGSFDERWCRSHFMAGLHRYRRGLVDGLLHRLFYRNYSIRGAIVNKVGYPEEGGELPSLKES